MDNPVIIFGAGGMGKTALDIFRSNGVDTYCFLDDNQALHDKEINNVLVMGRTDDDGFLKYIGKKCEAFVAIDENKYRQAIVTMLRERRKVVPVNAIHASAVISGTAHLGYGNFINGGAIVGTDAKISSHCIVHSHAVIDYEAELEDFVQVGAGSVINSGVKVRELAFIGSGVTIVSGVSIGKNARVGAGSVVIADVKEGQTVFGNPAKAV